MPAPLYSGALVYKPSFPPLQDFFGVSLGPRRKVWGQGTRNVLDPVTYAWIGRPTPARVGGAPRLCCEAGPGGAERAGAPDQSRRVAIARHRWLPRPLTLGMLINQAANRRSGRGAPLRRRGGHGSGARLLGGHGETRESEGLGGGEPGLLPAPGLQPAPVSPTPAPILLPSVLTSSSSICTPQPPARSSSTQKLAERGMPFSWCSGKGEDGLFRVSPPSSVPLSGDCVLP